MPEEIQGNHRSAARQSLSGRALALAGLLWLSGCGGQSPPALPSPEVSVAPVLQRTVTEYEDYAGRIEAIDRVEVRPRVAGHLAGVHFREGDWVEKGALLFTVDDREYAAAAEAARADLSRAEARLEAADSELARAEMLVGERAVSVSELEARRAERRQAQADTLAARAMLARAELALSFTRVRSPIAGRAGEAQVTPGNLVVPEGSLLTTVVSMDPVHVIFEAHESTVLGASQAPGKATRSVLVGVTGEAGFPHRGAVDFLDNAINPATGTRRMRASVPNPEGGLVPGAFARVRLMAASATEALLVHEQALLTDQDRRYVYVLGEGDTAVRKDVVLGPRIDGLRVVREGLAQGDQVIVNGVRKVFFPGQPVSPRAVSMDPPGTTAPAG